VSAGLAIGLAAATWYRTEHLPPDYSNWIESRAVISADVVRFPDTFSIAERQEEYGE
jgi:hypothetical protein